MRRIDLPEDGMSLDLNGLTADSRSVRPGYLFAALPGTKADGRTFIPAALAAGASVVLAPTGTVLPRGASARLIVHPQPEKMFARIASAFYGWQPEKIVAVTGTNGKTSTVSFCCQLWEAAGHKAAAMGTLGVSGKTLTREGSMTTPDTATLHSLLAEMAGAGVSRLAMEASSHGLAQHRMDAVRLSAAAFTNLTRDHLDYHGDMETYFKAKTRLFEEILLAGGTAVLSARSEGFETLRQISHARGHRIVTFGPPGCDLVLSQARPIPEGLDLRLEIFGRPYRTLAPVAGLFQAQNILCALGLSLALDPGCEEIFMAELERLRAPPGRAEKVGTLTCGASVYVDYAHTPDGLENILSSLRAHATGRLLCVFGCGGDRDPGKRPLMGKIAAELSDLCIITDDNPRTEDAAAIRAQILKAAPGAIDIPGRGAAIRHAVETLKAGDVLVVAGKGHERGQIIGTHIEPFDDAQEVRTAIARLEDSRRQGHHEEQEKKVRS